MSISVSNPSRLSTLPFDPELTPGARNAIQVCLRVKPEEKVTVITDEASAEIAASIVHEIEAVGAPYHAWILEELSPRPLVVSVPVPAILVTAPLAKSNFLTKPV